MGLSRQEYGVGCHFLLQGIFPTQGLNPHLLQWQVDSLPLHRLESPLEGPRTGKFIETERRLDITRSWRDVKCGVTVSL